jgi:hypothetical protein
MKITLSFCGWSTTLGSISNGYAILSRCSRHGHIGPPLPAGMHQEIRVFRNSGESPQRREVAPSAPSPRGLSRLHMHTRSSRLRRGYVVIDRGVCIYRLRGRADDGPWKAVGFRRQRNFGGDGEVCMRRLAGGLHRETASRATDGPGTGISVLLAGFARANAAGSAPFLRLAETLLPATVIDLLHGKVFGLGAPEPEAGGAGECREATHKKAGSPKTPSTRRFRPRPHGA